MGRNSAHFAGTEVGSGTRCPERVVPPPILKDRHHTSIWQRLNSLARSVDVPGSVLHHDEKLGDFGLDMMLPPVQGATVEDCASRRLIKSGALRHLRIVPKEGPTAPFAGSVRMCRLFL